MVKRTAFLSSLISAVLLSGVVSAPAATAFSPPGRAVVLVSGFNTVSPFSTSVPACVGKRGAAWNPPVGVATTLINSGFTVFTAPVKHGDKAPAPACAPGTPVPPVSSTYINSNGDLNANGQKLGNFLVFLRDNYGVTKVDLVGHSDGGLWSRAAITQQSAYPGVTISSLTTLGAPHTGSFVADLTEDVHNGQCQASGPIEQKVCLAFQKVVNLIVKDLGEATTEELTSDYMTTWNPEQRIRACQVTGIAGTYLNLPLPKSLLPAYYNPADGLVGEASALGQASKSITGESIPAPGIPNFTNGGEFPVVHGTAVSFLSKANLLNQKAISDTVAATLTSVQSSVVPCTQPTAQWSNRTLARRASLTDGSARVTFPLHNFAVPRHESFQRTRSSDVILSGRRVRLVCRGRRLPSTSFPSRSSLHLSMPGRCKPGVRVRGRGRALLVRTRGSATIVVHGTAVSVRLHGIPASRVELQTRKRKRFVRVGLGRNLRGTLPAAAGRTALRLIAKPRRGRHMIGSAVVSR